MISMLHHQSIFYNTSRKEKDGENPKQSSQDLFLLSLQFIDFGTEKTRKGFFFNINFALHRNRNGTVRFYFSYFGNLLDTIWISNVVWEAIAELNAEKLNVKCVLSPKPHEILIIAPILGVFPRRQTADRRHEKLQRLHRIRRINFSSKNNYTLILNSVFVPLRTINSS